MKCRAAWCWHRLVRSRGTRSLRGIGIMLDAERGPLKSSLTIDRWPFTRALPHSRLSKSLRQKRARQFILGYCVGSVRRKSPDMLRGVWAYSCLLVLITSLYPRSLHRQSPVTEVRSWTRTLPPWAGFLFFGLRTVVNSTMGLLLLILCMTHSLSIELSVISAGALKEGCSYRTGRAFFEKKPFQKG